ncbi:sigma-70 family RNA polymerase sigma factor [Candidatus Woesearchaeota archaeon]|nr:sigma-70 family RNA polymerase sigma factor [Candidatus Woesearchaeota archaeon]
MGLGKKHEKGSGWTTEGILLDVIHFAEQQQDLRCTVFQKARPSTMSALNYHGFGYREVMELCADYCSHHGAQELSSRFRSYEANLRRKDAFQTNPEVTKERLLERIQERHEAGLSLAVSDMGDDKGLHKEASRKFGNWKTAVEQATGIDYSNIAKIGRYSREDIMERLIKIARDGGDVRFWPLSQTHSNLATLISKKRQFQSHEEAIRCTRQYLLDRGETELADKFDYEKLQEQSRASLHRKRTTLPKEQPLEIVTTDDYDSAWLEEHNFGEYCTTGTLSGEELEQLLLRKEFIYITEAATRLGCSPDTIRVHGVPRNPKDVIKVHYGQRHRYLLRKSSLEKFVRRPRKETNESIATGLEQIKPDEWYSVKELTTILGIGTTTIFNRFTGRTVRNRREIQGFEIIAYYEQQASVVGKTIREVSQETGLQLGVIRRLCRQRRVQPEMLRGIALFQPKHIAALMLHVRGAEQARESIISFIDASREYSPGDLVAAGIPLSGLYRAMRRKRISYEMTESGRKIAGQAVIDFFASMRANYFLTYAEELCFENGLLVPPREAAQALRVSSRKAIQMLRAFEHNMPVKVQHTPTWSRNLIPQSSINALLREEEPLVTPIPQYTGHGQRGELFDELYVTIPQTKHRIETRVGLDTPIILELSDMIHGRRAISVTGKRKVSKRQLRKYATQLRRLQRREEQLKNEIVTQNERLVFFWTHKFRAGRDEDVIQAGMMGMGQALEKYNGSTAFSTYASNNIKWEIIRELQAKRMIRLPQQHRKTMKALRSFEAQYARTPTPEELSEVAGIQVGIARNVLETIRVASIDVPNDEGQTIAGSIPAIEQPEQNPHIKLVRSLIGQLNKREAEILSLRYGITDGTPWRLDEVAKKYKISRLDVRKIESLALRKLKRSRI